MAAGNLQKQCCFTYLSAYLPVGDYLIIPHTASTSIDCTNLILASLTVIIDIAGITGIDIDDGLMIWFLSLGDNEA